MPTVHWAYGYAYIIYLDDHPPPHVHVKGADGQAKMVIEPEVRIVRYDGLSRATLRKLFDEAVAERELLMQAWRRIHG